MNYQPLYRHRPPHRWTNGDLAAKVGADIGLPPDDEQLWLLDTIYAERATDRPASFEVGVISPRQNIKTSTLGIAALADLFVFGVERHLWTAHHGDTLKGTFMDFRSWIASNHDYDEQVTFYEGHQDMSIVHIETQNRIDFQSRTGKAGRGLTGVKRITLDEALYLEPKHVGAVYPTMLTRPGAQVRVASSAGLLTSEQLRRIRDRGRAGKDKRLAYVEYGAEVRSCVRVDCSHVVGSQGCALDDRELWWQANCALWCGRIDEDAIADQRASMPPDEFMREFLSWWEDPASLGGGLPYDDWVACQGASQIVSGLVLALAVSVDRKHMRFAAAGLNDDGLVHVELADNDDEATSTLYNQKAAVAEAKRLTSEHGANLVVDTKGPAASLVPLLEEAGVPLIPASTSDVCDACAVMFDRVQAHEVRHLGDAVLNAAVAGAIARPIGDRFAWGRRQSTVDISPLEAITLAAWQVELPSRELVPSFAYR